MNPERMAWNKLVAAARRAPSATADESAPYGFSTRVAALGLATSRAGLKPLLERFSWRAVSVAALLALLTVASTVQSSTNTSDDEASLDGGAAIALLEVS